MIYALIKRKRVPRGPERLRGVRAALAVRVRAAQAEGPVVLLPETLEEAKAAGAEIGDSRLAIGESQNSEHRPKRGKPFGRKPGKV